MGVVRLSGFHALHGNPENGMRRIQAILSRVAWINSDRLLSGHINLVRVFRAVSKDIFGVSNQRRMTKDKVIVEGVMIGGDQDVITLLQALLGKWQCHTNSKESATLVPH